jgi:hypothetical protein
MTPDEATGPLILEWTSWKEAFDEASRDFHGIFRGTGTTDSAASDLRYLMFAIQERMDAIRTQIDEVAIDTSVTGPGSAALVEWLRCFKPAKAAAEGAPRPIATRVSYAAPAAAGLRPSTPPSPGPA